MSKEGNVMSTETYMQTHEETTSTIPELSGLAKGMRWGFLGSMVVLTAMVLGQFFLVGLFTFDDPARRLDHANLGHAIGLITYVHWILPVLGRMGWKVITGSVVLFVTAHLQYMFMDFDSGVMNAMHALNGSLVLLNTAWLTAATIGMIRGKR